MSASLYKAPSLSAREASLLAELERDRRIRVTLEEIRGRVGRAAPDVVKGLIRKGALQRVGTGIYLAVPMRRLAKPSTYSSQVMVASLLEGEPYYLGGLWALTHHRLTAQQFASRIDVFTHRRRVPRQLGSARVVFHVLPDAQWVHGVVAVSLEGVRVYVSDPERTVLDALDHPRWLGGLRRALELLVDVAPRLQRSRLIRYAAQGSSTATCQRLAVLLERQGLTPRQLAPLRRRVRESRSLLSMLPAARRTGRLNASWRVVENDR